MDDFRLGNGTRAFTDYGNKFVDSNVKTVQEQKDLIFSIANKCRGWYLPEFADEHKYLPVSKPIALKKEESGHIHEVPVVQVGELNTHSSTGTSSAQYLTVPPERESESDKLLQYILIGIGAIVVYKLFLT